MFSELEVINKKSESTAGGDIVSFRFNLSDDTSYEMIYYAEAVKAGRLKLPKEQVDYFASADIEGYWELLHMKQLLRMRVSYRHTNNACSKNAGRW